MQSFRFISAALALWLLQGCSPEVRGPNVIHITADDLGYGELGSFGQTLIATPHLDALAAQGMRFTQHYAGNALCNPSRYAFQTGKHSGTTGVVSNGANTLPAGDMTIAKLMRTAGYFTGVVGKWALGPPSSDGAPLNQGFDYFFGYPTQVAAHNYFPETLMENNRRIPMSGNSASGELNISAVRDVYSAEVIHERALAFIEKYQERPFYLQLDYNLPHVNNELHKMTGNGFEVPGESRYADHDWTIQEKDYAEMVSLMDDYVGELVAKIHSLGIERNTLIIFTSDNGPTGVRGRSSLERFASTAGLRGMKGMIFEGGIRVPMIAWWPGKIAAGASTEEVTTFWDVLPTFAELVGRPDLVKGDGYSFAPVMLGHGQMPRERVLYWAVRDRKAVRYGDWKWVHHPMDSRSDFLFNIVDDPNELTNLASKHPEILSRLQHMADEVVVN
jgi:uncharacterized sulfatase